MDRRHLIARRVAQELRDGNVVNLGIGLPTLVANYVPKGIKVVFQGENGILGIGGVPPKGKSDRDIFDAGCANATVLPGGSYFDSADSFGLIRGGHVDIAVLGALQVDAAGNLANWVIPGRMLAGYGGAMDLISCAKKVIVAMEHTSRGEKKILEMCDFPLTGAGCVSLIVTDLGVIEVTGGGLVLREIFEDVTVNEVLQATGAPLTVASPLAVIKTE